MFVCLKEMNTYCVPHDDVYVTAEGIVEVLRDVEVNKVTEMMVHVHSCKRQAKHACFFKKTLALVETKQKAALFTQKDYLHQAS